MRRTTEKKEKTPIEGRKRERPGKNRARLKGVRLRNFTFQRLQGGGLTPEETPPQKRKGSPSNPLRGKKGGLLEGEGKNLYMREEREKREIQ